MAAIYAAYVAILYASDGPAAFTRHGITLGSTILAYITAGIVAGAAVGVFLPLWRSRAGAFVVATMGSWCAYLPIMITLFGPPWSWDTAAWMSLAIEGPLFGLILSVLWYRKPRDPVKAADLRPRLRTVRPSDARVPDAERGVAADERVGASMVTPVGITTGHHREPPAQARSRTWAAGGATNE